MADRYVIEVARVRQVIWEDEVISHEQEDWQVFEFDYNSPEEFSDKYSEVLNVVTAMLEKENN
jgi:hypothetical protein